jgi:hypothetical protein
MARSMNRGRNDGFRDVGWTIGRRLSNVDPRLALFVSHTIRLLISLKKESLRPY